MKTSLIINVEIPGTPAGSSRVLFNDETILAVGDSSITEAEDIYDAKGALLLPGVIDAHVHFREPGMTYKADISTESKAAMAGGVTSFFDMPNTLPPTTTITAWKEKMDLAHGSSAINYSFFIGATNHNVEEIIRADFSRIPGIKVFLGSSTGNMLLDDNSVLEFLFKHLRVPIVVHAEDEHVIRSAREKAIKKYNGNPPIYAHSEIRPHKACIEATDRAIRLLSRHPEAHLHIAHLSTAEELNMVRQAKNDRLHITCEVSPHHLLFTQDDYENLGARIKMNPSVKTAADRDALREGLIDGTIDIIATDHAPHLLSEKEGNALTAVSGAPMVQFSLPVILDMFGPETAIKAMSLNPARIFGIRNRGMIAVGYKPEMVLVEKIAGGYNVDDRDVLSKCGWTPIKGKKLYHRVIKTIIPRAEEIRFRN